MPSSRRALAVLCLALLPLAPAPLSNATATGGPPRSADREAAVETLFDWQATAVRTIYNPAEGARPIPVGTLYLGFTSLAVHDAVRHTRHSRHVSASAAVAQAAHDVLLRYFPTSQSNLDADLMASLATVPDGAAEDRGRTLGEEAAARLIASRAGDTNLENRSIVYARDQAPGIWQPQPPNQTGMVAAWLGFVRPLVLRRPVAVNGPDRLTSAAYARDFNEVKVTGSSSTTADRAIVARFFFDNSVVAYENALISYLREHPIGLSRTARLFAVINASMADALRNVWRLKYDVALWRPWQAVPLADTDENPATVADPSWVPLLQTPSYPEYPSGHAAVTGTFAEGVRMFLGDSVPLVLVSVVNANDRRPYFTLRDLEHDAFNARIWSGIHFRDAMDDGYLIAHETARRVARILD